MPRSSSFRAALAGLITAGLACLGAQAPADAAPAAEGDPLVVHIDTLDPVLPRSGDVVITGTVTNVSEDTYTRINLHAFSSEQPILDSLNLVNSAASDPKQAVGDRVTVPGTFYTVNELAPGATAYFSDTVPVELLEMDPRVEGVYWIGIHAFGDGAVPRDGFADGRARTFIPAQPGSDGSAEAAVTLSIRSRVWFTDDGKVAGLDRWAKRLAEGGSLDGVLDMADSADATPYSWLVDPAVLVALTRLERGNPARSIVPDPNLPDQQPTETPATEEGAEPSEAPGGWDTLAPPTSPSDEPTAQEQALASASATWLNRFRDLVDAQPVLTLPFGDLDVSAAVRNDRLRLDQAVARSAEVMRVLRLPTRPAVSPTGDLLSPEALQTVAPDTVVLLGDSAFDLPPTTPNSVVKMLGHKVLVTSTAAESGGPGPTAATDPLAMRQRLLSEAALRALDEDSAPLILTLPTVWRGEDAAAFFDQLEQPWLDVVPVEEVADDRKAVGQPASSLNYTPEDQQAEIGAGNFTAATRSTNAASLLEEVLRLQTTIEAQVRDEALVTLSEQHAARPGIALKAAGRLEQAVLDYLGKIRIEAPPAVTLFSASGKLGATLVNGLDQPVEVEVRPTTDGQLRISGLSGRRTLGPSARSVLRYEATTDQLGTHNVRFIVTSVEGAPLGSSDALPIRAARVSALVWVAMAGGALVLFGMIGYRLPGQIRARRAALAVASRGEVPATAEDDEQADVRDARDESPSDVRPESPPRAPLLPGRP